ncbi:MAG: hypothetical protein KGZ63_11250, partial [Clostridiales bacterium]|nr:hypothetical protein [Clostridiales bacterium]
MENTTIIQGRETTYEDIMLVQNLIAANPDWHRTRLSKELCELWNWYNSNGQIKDMACRTFLLKLEQRGYLTLPVRRRPGGSSYQQSIPKVPHSTDLILGKLKSVAPVTIKQVDKT